MNGLLQGLEHNMKSIYNYNFFVNTLRALASKSAFVALEELCGNVGLVCNRGQVAGGAYFSLVAVVPLLSRVHNGTLD